MFTNLPPFVSTSTADPLLSNWSQISDSICTILDMCFVKYDNFHLIIFYCMFKPLSSTWFQIIQIYYLYQFGFLWTCSLVYSATKYYIYFGLHYHPPGHLTCPFLRLAIFFDSVDSRRFGLFLFDAINNTWNRDSEIINEFTTQPQGCGKTLNPIEPR